MTPGIKEFSNDAPSSAITAEDAGKAADLTAGPCGGLFQRQLAVAGLEEVAEKIAIGAELDLCDAVALSRADLPLLGRMVQLCHCASDCVGAASPARQVGQPLSDWDSFCHALFSIRGEAEAGSEPLTWYPRVTRPPDEEGASSDNFTGADVLRAIALARLLLPECVTIVAPLATLGPKLAQVALEFGASHLGFAPLDGQAAGPLTADPEVLRELQESSLPTALKEDL